ncbi:hypothetical protein ACEQ8H_006650 [Pleosporales sp. CAS-2024a]
MQIRPAHLIDEKDKCCFSTRLLDEASLPEQPPDKCIAKYEAVIMSEVADWWQSHHVDDFWAPRSLQQRFEPAAGHQARVSSETDAWPEFDARPSLEENLAEVVSLQTRDGISDEQNACCTASSWTDGTPPPEKTHARERSLSAASSSPKYESGFFARLICQASTPKNPRRKHGTLFTNSSTKGQAKFDPLHTQSDVTEPHRSRPRMVQNFTEQAVQRIPSMFRLRRIQSASWASPGETNDASNLQSSRRHSSNPSIGSSLAYPFEIPEIRRISATPANSPYERHASHGLRLCGRGDLIADGGYFDSQPNMSFPPISAFMYSTSMSSNTLSLPELGADVLSPLAVSPRSGPSMPFHPPKDYFASVHAATHVHDDKDFDIDNKDDLTEERESAGPRLEESPYLQQIFAKMDADEETYMSDDDSSDGALDRGKKRRGILADSGSTSSQIAEMFSLNLQISKSLDD